MWSEYKKWFLPLLGIFVVVVWEAFSSGLAPRILFAAGTFIMIGKLFRENYQLKLRMRPHLMMRFDDSSPYVRDKPMHTGGVLRIFSVGVVNTGESVDNVSVKLVSIEPREYPSGGGSRSMSWMRLPMHRP
jgi:hypothetical protein